MKIKFFFTSEILKKIFNIKVLMTFLSLSFVFYSAYLNLSRIREIVLSGTTIYWLFIGFLISTFSLYINAYAWKKLIFSLGYSLKDVKIISLFIRTNLLKYVPGGVWHFVERLRVLKSNMSSFDALICVLMEPLLMCSAAFLLVPLGGWQSGFSAIFWLPLISLMPRFRGYSLTLLRRLKGKQLERVDLKNTSDYPLEIPSKGYPFIPLLLETLFIIFRFIGFYCCLKAFSLAINISFIKWLSIFSLAWLAGLVVPSAPGGIGIFESVVLLKSIEFPDQAIIVVAIIFYRVIATISDLIAPLIIAFKGSSIAR